jgi:hypothetical protein
MKQSLKEQHKEPMKQRIGSLKRQTKFTNPNHTSQKIKENTKIRDEKRFMTTDTTEIHTIIREYFEILYAQNLLI